MSFTLFPASAMPFAPIWLKPTPCPNPDPVKVNDVIVGAACALLKPVEINEKTNKAAGTIVPIFLCFLREAERTFFHIVRTNLLNSQSDHYRFHQQ